MNHIYKLKFDRSLLELIVVSELATQSVTGSRLVALSEDHQQLDVVTSSSLYDCSLSELIFSMATVAYSLAHTTAMNSNYQVNLANNNLFLTTESLDNFKSNFKALNCSNYNFTSRNLLALSLLVGSFGAATNVLAAPTVYGTHGQEGTVVAGTVSSVTDGLVTTITNSPNAIIDWKQFNINQNEILKFVQKTADSAVLNRVLGNQVSKILGTLQSNGQVFIVNPNGIVFGSKSHVDVGGLVASTLDINNNDFLHGHYVFNKDKDQAIAKVLNSGVIKIKDDGSLALIGGQVVNNGVLEAKHGTVFLLAGNSIEIADLHNPLVSYKVTAKNKAVNLGRVLGQNAVLLGNQVLNGKASKYTAGTFADVIGTEDTSANQASINADGQVVLFGGSQADTLQSTDQANNQVVGKRNSLVENNGVINVLATTGSAGTVKVLGDYIHTGSASHILAQGTDTANGGQVLIGGDATGTGTVKLAKLDLASAGSIVDVSAQVGNAGHVVFWGNRTAIDGNLKATSQTGKGGFVETSGHSIKLGDNLQINTNSLANSQDKTLGGTWLLDPEYFAIVGSSDDFTQHVNHKLIGRHTVFNPNNDPASDWQSAFQVSDTAGADDVSYITTEQLKSKAFQTDYFSLIANRGLVLYNVTGNLNNYIKNLDIYLLPDDSKYYEIAIKNSDIDNNINVSFGEASGLMSTDVSVYIQNSKLSLNDFNTWNLNKLSITDSYINASDLNTYNTTLVQVNNSTLIGTGVSFNQLPVLMQSAHDQYVPGVASTSTDQSTIYSKANSVIEITNNSVINATQGTVSLTSANIINIQNSTIFANQSVLIIPDGSHAKSFNIANSTITADTDNIVIQTAANTNISHTQFNANTGLGISGQSTNVDLNLDHTNITLKPVTNANSNANVYFQYLHQINASNVNINTSNLLFNAQNTTITNSVLNATGSYVRFKGDELHADHLQINGHNEISFYNVNNTSINDFNHTTINSDIGVIRFDSKNFKVNQLNLSASSITVETENTEFTASHLKAKNDVNLAKINLYGFSNHNLTLTDSSITGANVNLTVVNTGKLHASNSTVTATVNTINTTSGFINLENKTNFVAQNNLTLNASATDPKALNVNATSLSSKLGNISLVTTNSSAVVSHSVLNAKVNLNITSASNLTLNHNTEIAAQGSQGVDLQASHNLTLANSRVTITTGSLNVTAGGSFQVEHNQVKSDKLINIISHNNSLVDGNLLESNSGVSISTAAGQGTLYFGKNQFNGKQEIAVNANTPNPVVCIYGQDQSYDYTSYNHHGGLCLDSNSGSTKPDVTVVTNDLKDDIANDPNNLGLNNQLSDLIENRTQDLPYVEHKASGDLNIANNCRPHFITLVKKYKISIDDIRYGREQALIYKYKITAEQAEFLFNCYAHNIDYFSLLYSKTNS